MKDFLYEAVCAAEKAGARLMRDFGTFRPSTRGTAKEVKSRYDRLADKIVLGTLRVCFPAHSFLTEESGFIGKKSDYLWIIDPVDGTGNYVNGNPFFAISISLWHCGQPLLGLIEAPALGERFYAELGAGAWIKNLKSGKVRRAHVSSTKDCKRAYFVYCDGGEDKKSKLVPMLSKFYPQLKDMRKLGSAALECAWVGAGRADAYITPRISLWDIAAGVLFVNEAGGAVFDFDAKPYTWPRFFASETCNIVATNGKLPRIHVPFA